jgi:protein TonB
MLTFDRWDDLKLNRASGELKRTFLEGVSQRFPASRPDEGAVKRPVPAYEIHDDLLADYSSGPRSYAPRESSPEPRSADEIAGAELQLLPAATRSVSAVWPAEAIQLARDLPQSLRFPPPASSPQTFYPTGHLVAPDWLDGPITLPEAISRSLLEQQVAPEYPKEVRPWLDGSVVLQASIASDGTVREVKLLSGYLALGRAAAQAVKQWRYRPYRHNGRNVAVQTLITVDFKRPPQG